ncbi:triosephosphate isomerase [Escherichia fergusonii]|nr:triosephosphate isomerase [Escherichia fergusonii]
MKKQIHINLKRFDVLHNQGGLCPDGDAQVWVQRTLQRIIDLGWGRHPQLHLTVYLPDLLLSAAVALLRRNPSENVASLALGTQSCHVLDVAPGGNFGAFTSHSLASAQAAMGSEAALIGHCEERLWLQHLLQLASAEGTALSPLVSQLICEKVKNALNQGMKVTLCLGETAGERGEGDDATQIARARKVLENQLAVSLAGIDGETLVNRVTLAYEPVWAIGPGKTPPNGEYIAQTAEFIKHTTQQLTGVTLPVIYGGGLKAENAAEIGKIAALDGGLIALTRFTPPIGFCPEELNAILTTYCG